MSLYNQLVSATTALRSACDWLCCAGSSARGDQQQQSEVPRSTHAAYEVVESGTFHIKSITSILLFSPDHVVSAKRWNDGDKQQYGLEVAGKQREERTEDFAD